jgi:hypothetical protein
MVSGRESDDWVILMLSCLQFRVRGETLQDDVLWQNFLFRTSKRRAHSDIIQLGPTHNRLIYSG